MHTVHYTVLTAPEAVPVPESAPVPEPVPVPESAHVHFILHIEHCRLNTTHLYCMLHTYQELAELELKLVTAK